MRGAPPEAPPEMCGWSLQVVYTVEVYAERFAWKQDVIYCASLTVVMPFAFNMKPRNWNLRNTSTKAVMNIASAILGMVSVSVFS